jgi:CRP/FNR family cyclic AMP-dependent transcriptional regulator
VNLSALPLEKANAVIAGGKRMKVVRGEIIYTALDRPLHVYFVIAGRVKILRTSSGGTEAIVGIRNPGDIFAELSWIEDMPQRASSAVALDVGEVVRVDAAEFGRRIAADPELAAAFARGVTRRLADAEIELTELAGKSVPGRLIDALGRLAQEHGVVEEDGSLRIGISLTHKDLADLIGTSRETLTKELAVLADLGLVRISHRSIALVQPEAFPSARPRS